MAIATGTAALIGAGASAAASAYGSTQKKRSTSKVTQDKFIRDASMDAVQRARSIAGRPYTAFGGERVAGLSENERQASRLAGSFGDRFKPYQDRLADGFSRGALEQFENPYLDKVLAQRKRGIGEEFGRQSADLQRRQSAMDAFRTGRSDLARSRLDESRMRALDEAEAGARDEGFKTALEAYFRQGQQDLGAMETSGRLGAAEIEGLARTGLTERSVAQAERDFDYGQFLERRDWDVNNLQPLLDAIQAARGDVTRTDTKPGENKWSAYGGLLSSLFSSGFGGGGGGGGGGGLSTFGSLGTGGA